MVILIVGTHPDDIELGIGATIHRLRNKHEFHGLILTSGQLRADPNNREQVTMVSAETLGFHPHFARLKDGAFTDFEVEKVVRAKIDDIRPDMVIARCKNENHRAHIAAHTGTISAARKVGNILLFESPYTSNFSLGRVRLALARIFK